MHQGRVVVRKNAARCRTRTKKASRLRNGGSWDASRKLETHKCVRKFGLVEIILRMKIWSVLVIQGWHSLRTCVWFPYCNTLKYFLKIRTLQWCSLLHDFFVLWSMAMEKKGICAGVSHAWRTKMIKVYATPAIDLQANNQKVSMVWCPLGQSIRAWVKKCEGKSIVYTGS